MAAVSFLSLRLSLPSLLFAPFHVLASLTRMDFLHRVEAVVILDAGGKRLFAKYFSGEDTPASSKALASVDKQRALECLIQQVVRDPKMGGNTSAYSRTEIVIVSDHAVLYQFGDDCTFVVMGSAEENEQVLATVLNTLVDALKQEIGMLSLSTRSLLENYDAVLLTVDEMLDNGVILETNPSNVVAEVEPFIVDTGTETAHKVFSTVNKYLRENL